MDEQLKQDSDKVQDDAKVVVHDVRVMAEDLVRTVRGLIREGSVRRITVKDKEGRVIAIFPVSAGVLGALFAPSLVAVGALSAVLTECTLSVEKAE